MTEMLQPFKEILAFFNWGTVPAAALIAAAFIWFAVGLSLSRKPQTRGQEQWQTTFRFYAAALVALLLGVLVFSAGAVSS